MFSSVSRCTCADGIRKYLTVLCLAVCPQWLRRQSVSGLSACFRRDDGAGQRQHGSNSTVSQSKLFPIKVKWKYEALMKIFGKRNSCSKTDYDAALMRMEEDAMLNGQLKPGYKIQIRTENRYIARVTIHPNPTDTKIMLPYLQHLKEKPGKPASMESS